ncbi:hypothetical protein F8388_015362 [Cannabis sativa]|uniref:Peroxisomal membrane protein 2 n=1 Tax=Cannabis sativa TaxID=3483 RepID=A0A7J6GHY3_CANSA|nr:hypothetical protein F8388_015362 [Cannabis sativa]
MATLNTIISHGGHGVPSFTIKSKKDSSFTRVLLPTKLYTKLDAETRRGIFSTRKRRNWVLRAIVEEQELAPGKPNESKEEDNALLSDGSEKVEPFSSLLPVSVDGEEDWDRLTSRAINAAIVLGFGTLAITKLFTIDHEYWHGWTIYEVLRYAPQHNWIAYEQALKANPVLSKMVISGVVYAIGDWIAQCYEGKPIFEIERTRVFRSGLVGFTLHGSLSHYYYQFCEALFPFEDWWVVPAKVAFDQTVWAAIWNSIYFFVLGLLRFESPVSLLNELKSTFWPLLTAGWKLWPFAHLITYGVVPIEQRLLWVDCVELVWVTILSTYSNEKSESRVSETSVNIDSDSSSSHNNESKVRNNILNLQPVSEVQFSSVRFSFMTKFVGTPYDDFLVWMNNVIVFIYYIVFKTDQFFYER